MTAVKVSPNMTTPSQAISAPGRNRATVYDGLIGRSPNDYDRHGGYQIQRADPQPLPEDFLHVISIACGYSGLIAGFGALATAIW